MTNDEQFSSGVNIDSTTKMTIGKKFWISTVVWTIIFLIIIWSLALFLYLPVNEPIFNPWILNTGGVASFPMWGYSILIKLFGSVTAVIYLQSFLGAFSSAVLLVTLCHLVPCAKNLLKVLFIIALPWWSYQAFAYQMPISASFMLLGLISLSFALSGQKFAAILAGICFGLGQNFRTELLLLPSFIFIVSLIFRRLHYTKFTSIRPFVITIIIALLFQVPWAINCKLNANRFSLSESNLGHVMYLGLGQVKNPWNIIATDSFAQKTIDSAGLKCYSLSFEGSSYLFNKSIQSIRQRPAAFVQIILWRTKETLFHPFSSLSWAKNTNDESTNDVYKFSWEQQKIIISKLFNQSISGAMYKIGTALVSRIIAIVGIIGLFLSFRNYGIFKANQHLVILLAIAILYRLTLNIAVFASGKYMTSVFLCYLPFTVNSILFTFKVMQNSMAIKQQNILND